jgi:phage shock protein C
VSKSDREKRDAERAARRASRLAQRAEQRAKRKEEQAIHAMDRAERLAERANKRPKRERDLDKSIEDFVDEVTDKWTRKAEDWIDEQSTKLFDSSENAGYETAGDDYAEQEYEDAEKSARSARRAAETANRRAEEAEQHASRYRDDAEQDSDFGERSRSRRRTYSRQSSKRSRRRGRRFSGYDWSRGDWSWSGWTSRMRHRGNLYRDTRNKRVCGVCAGASEYLGVETWQLRLMAVLGLIFIPTVTIPVYFITYFLMDKKPYYRQVTDRFDDLETPSRKESRKMRKARKKTEEQMPDVTNKEAMRKAKSNFGDIEARLRQMETHVTSSTFELDRELNKISVEDK